MVCQSVVVPLLDRAERIAVPVVESEHNASTCVQWHDHRICTQYSTNHQSPSDSPTHDGEPQQTVALARPFDEIILTLASRTSFHSRAPPSAPQG
jgi:hypothetical protein